MFFKNGVKLSGVSFQSHDWSEKLEGLCEQET